MATTTRGLPYPVTGDGRPHIDLAIKALADQINTWEGGMTDAQIGALSGADLWDGRLAFQTDTGTVRKWRGLYMYLSGAAAWRCLVPLSGGVAWTPTITAASGGLNLGSLGYTNGFYVEQGDFIKARGTIHWEASGSATGTGVWSITLPTADAYASHIRTVGRARFIRGTVPVSTSQFMGDCVLNGSGSFKVVGISGELGSTTAPFAAAPNVNAMQFSVRYRR